MRELIPPHKRAVELTFEIFTMLVKTLSGGDLGAFLV